MWVDHGGRAFDHHGWWWGFMGGIVPLVLFLVLIGVGVWLLLRVASRAPAHAPALTPASAPWRDGPLEEVRFRYARGEISREEFIQRSEDLGATEPGPGQPSPPNAG